jgi:hypothetical protein
MLSESLETIHLCGNFNKPIDNLPINIKCVRLISKPFLQSINLLPNSVEILQLNPAYNKKINKLPNKLQIILIHGWARRHIDCERIKKLTNAKIKFFGVIPWE